MTSTPLYLKFPNKSQLAVNVRLTDAGLFVQGVNRPEISFIIGGITDLQVALTPAARAPKKNVLGMSPADVVRYYEQSPILCIYVEDVRTAVLSHSEGTGGDFQLSQDLEAVQGLVEPSMADISEKLTGNRYYSGRTYKRIKTVHSAFYSSSSGVKGRSRPEEESKAA